MCGPNRGRPATESVLRRNLFKNHAGAEACGVVVRSRAGGAAGRMDALLGVAGRQSVLPKELGGCGAVAAVTQAQDRGHPPGRARRAGAPLTFWMARARDTPGSPTSWRVFLPRIWNFCLLTFTSNGLGLGLARPPRAPAGAFVRAPAALAFPMAYTHRTPSRPSPHGLRHPEEARRWPDSRRRAAYFRKHVRGPGRRPRRQVAITAGEK